MRSNIIFAAWYEHSLYNSNVKMPKQARLAFLRTCACSCCNTYLTLVATSALIQEALSDSELKKLLLLINHAPPTELV